MQHEGDGANPVIGTVMRQGYRLGEGPVLRNAMVGVVDSVDSADTTGTHPGGGAQNGIENSESNQ